MTDSNQHSEWESVLRSEATRMQAAGDGRAGLLISAADELHGLIEQLETLRQAAQDYRTLVVPQYEGEEWEAAQELDAALGRDLANHYCIGPDCPNCFPDRASSAAHELKET